MAMLLRTRSRNLALFLRVTFILIVSVSYLIISVFSVGKARISAVYEENHGEYKAQPNSRHLLVVENDLNSKQEVTIQDEYFAKQIRSAQNASTQFLKITKNCTRAAINDFPGDGLTRVQRKQGWVIVHVILACYLFIFLAVVCDNYFVPAIRRFCDNLNLKEDVAGATFMATASSSAEIFINSIGTFITEGDIGVGTIVGSAVFNILAVPACCGLFANMVLDMEWWPISRDSGIYLISVMMLISFLQDGQIHFYEALALVLMYTFYIFIMVYNNKLSALAHKIVAKFRKRSYYKEIICEAHSLLFQKNGKYDTIYNILEYDVTLQDCEKFDESTCVWEWPSECTTLGKFWWILTWPISFVLYISTPDCRNYPKLYVVTFIMCIFWIATTSYLVAWLITVIGDTLDIPDSVMGLTFLAAGTSVPEAVSAVIVTNQGHGSMGISSSIGSNTFDILLCLGIPWLIKTAFYPAVPGEHIIHINSSGINYSAACLLITIVLLYASISANGFKLDWKVGLTCLFMYIVFLVFASLLELNVFFPVNLPLCGR